MSLGLVNTAALQRNYIGSPTSSHRQRAYHVHQFQKDLVKLKPLVIQA